jgi:hypothetical protein
MSKLIQRIGTITHKYEVDIILHKIEVNFKSPGTVSVQFKRGAHVCQTKKAQYVEKGNTSAVYEEKLTIPVTLYQDKKTLKFQEKRAELIVSQFGDKKTKRLGLTIFDLSEFLNKNVKEKRMDIPIKSCHDSKAKFCLTIKIHSRGAPVDTKQEDPASDDESHEESTEQEEKSKEEEKSELVKQLEDMQNANAYLLTQLESGNKRNASPSPTPDTRYRSQTQDSQLKSRELERKQALAQNENDMIINNLSKASEKASAAVALSYQMEEKERKIKELEDMVKKSQEDFELYKQMTKGKIRDLTPNRKESGDKTNVSSLKSAVIEEKEKRIKDLEEAVKKNEQEIELYKNVGKNKAKEELIQLTTQIRDLENKLKAKEADTSERIKQLEYENQHLTKENDKLTTSNNQITIKYEREQAQLQIETEELRKQQKDMQLKLTSSRTDTKEMEQLKSKIIKLEDSLAKYDQELAQAKFGWANLEMEKEALLEQLKQAQTKTNQMGMKAQSLEEELLMTKKNLGEALNAAFEYGGSELLDKIEEKVTFGEH